MVYPEGCLVGEVVVIWITFVIIFTGISGAFSKNVLFKWLLWQAMAIVATDSKR